MLSVVVFRAIALLLCLKRRIFPTMMKSFESLKNKRRGTEKKREKRRLRALGPLGFRTLNKKISSIFGGERPLEKKTISLFALALTTLSVRCARSRSLSLSL